VKILSETKTIIIKNFEKIYLFMCLCMNRRKLELEKLKLMASEENEILREDYMKCKVTIYIIEYSTERTQENI
jgi:hypothetical protein